MSSSRRAFMRAAAATVAGIGLLRRRVWAVAAAAVGAGPDGAAGAAAPLPVVVSTWPFAMPGNEVALAALAGGASALDAVEQGIRLVEGFADEHSVGLGGTPNAEGVVQLDACIMGPEYRAGSVAALEGILHPISVARRVLEATPHVMLVGEGARRFAAAQGCEQGELLTEERRRAWEEWRARHPAAADTTHDTVTMLAVDAAGHVAGGCSTSGWGYKLPGRVGDSPIIGAGLYVDSTVGAAGATGLGEIIMRHCGSFAVVEGLRRGLEPEAACAEVVRQIVQREPAAAEQAISFVAVDRLGRFGAAGTARGFEFNVTCPAWGRTLPGRLL